MTQERRATTVRLAIDTIEWLKVTALREHRTMTDVVEEAVAKLKEAKA